MKQWRKAISFILVLTMFLTAQMIPIESYAGTGAEETVIVQKTDLRNFSQALGEMISAYEPQKTSGIFSVQSAEDDFENARLIVKSEETDLDYYGASAVVRGYDALHVVQYETPAQALAACTSFAALDSVEYAEADGTVYASDTWESGYVYKSWGWGDTHVDAAEYNAYLRTRDASVSLPAIVVAVLDTGITTNHAMFYKDGVAAGRISGGAFFNGSSSIVDEMGHGTHVAGTIADGTLPNVYIMPMRVLGTDGSGEDSGIALAVREAANQGADVINMSLGGEGTSRTMEEACAYAIARGVTIVVAAGNEGVDAINFSPANIDGVITVAATDQNNEKASFSNYGAMVDIAAPGVGILSAKYNTTDGTILFNGTSMACPHVAAAAAMLLSEDADYTNGQILARLQSAASPAAVSGLGAVGVLNMRNLIDPEFYISLNRTEAELYAGDAMSLRANTVSEAAVTWECSDSGVVTLNVAGATAAAVTVTAVGAGTARITASALGHSAGCTVTVASEGAWYTAVSGNSYHIANEADFRNLARLVNSGRDDFLNKTVYLDEDITLTGGAWTPVGNSVARAFAGAFDGQGHTVSAMAIEEGSYVGLFGTVSGDIRNVCVRDASVTASAVAGLLVGYSLGMLENCTVSGILSVSGNYAGGVCGKMAGEGNALTAHITLSAKQDRSKYAGGITGCLENAFLADSTCTGNISGASEYMGGLVGSMVNAVLDNSCYTGTISCGGYNVGGAAGALRNSLICNTAVSADIDGKMGIGGLAGSSMEASLLINCAVQGTVSGTDAVSGIASVNMDSEISNCVSGATVSGTSNLAAGVVINCGGTVSAVYLPATMPGVGETTEGGVTENVVTYSGLTLSEEIGVNGLTTSALDEALNLTAENINNEEEDFWLYAWRYDGGSWSFVKPEITISGTPEAAKGGSAVLTASCSAVTPHWYRWSVTPAAVASAGVLTGPAVTVSALSVGTATVAVNVFGIDAVTAFTVTDDGGGGGGGGGGGAVVPAVSTGPAVMPTAAAVTGGAVSGSGIEPAGAQDFDDVSETEWYYEAVDYVVRTGLFAGTGANTFEPNAPMTRGMFMTVLWRAAGMPAAGGDETFSDVPEERWYTEAVKWAAENGIARGMGGSLFMVNESITREQMAVFLYQYAKLTGDPEVAEDRMTIQIVFPDIEEASDWSWEAAAFCLRSKVIIGMDSQGNFGPKETATRAQVAAIFMRYLEGKK